MRSWDRCCRAARRWQRRMLSVPLFVKILGIGVLVAAVFGTVTLVAIRGSIAHALRQMQEQRAWSMSRSIAVSIERPISTGDVFAVHERLRQARQMFPDIRYLIVRDRQGDIVTHSFDHGVPPDLAAMLDGEPSTEETFYVLASESGAVFHVRCPILGGHGGGLELGISDRMIAEELSAITGSVLWSLMLCTAVGTLLGLVLTHLVTHPIHHLVNVARAVSLGDFTAKSHIYSADEIGRLAVAFNQMTAALQRYCEEVAERERGRRALIAKIVHAQEEERRNISRELHDELGQSLLALLLKVQTEGAADGALPAYRRDLEERIRRIIEQVRRLAWGMHPSILDDYGLDSALSRHVQEVGNRSGPAIDYQSLGAPDQQRLAREVEATLYRVAQEALTNAVRHARATQCSVLLLRDQQSVTLLVEDDGCGFDIRAVNNRREGGLGLTGIRERVAMVGGHCEIESSAGTGTTVRVRVPLSPAAEEYSI